MPAKSRDEKIFIGASWYPEMWPAEQWPVDIGKMRELGFNVVRLFEFAWHRFEPVETQYDFEWARQIMDLCHAAGIKVIIGTPTAAPPAWLSSKYPEILQTKYDGSLATHGKRKHYNHHNEKYRELCRGITQKILDELGEHPALYAWQIDNEMSGRDYSEVTLKKFHGWLSDRYGSIQQLNQAWGLEFWSQAYDDFSQIPMPEAQVGSIEVPERHHPSLIFAVARFQSDAWVDFISNQTEIIRAKSDKPITTNMCGSGLNMDWHKINGVLDRVGYSVYADLEHYDWTIERYDRMRGEKPGADYWLLETAPNWSGGGRQWNIHHNATGMNAASWLSTALGGTMTLFWQWREHWAGQEMNHGTCVTATGKWRPNKAAWMKLSKDYDKVGDWLVKHPCAQAEVAILRSAEAAWAFSVDPLDENMQYEKNWREYFYHPLVKSHIWRDIIGEDQDFSPYKIIIAPLMPILKTSTRQQLEQWVRDGGVLILGPLTGYRTEEFTVYRDHEFGGLEEMIGAEPDLGFSAHWREEVVSVRLANQTQSKVRAWCESFRVQTAEAIGWYEGPGEYGHQQIAVTANDYGAGSVVTLGALLEPDAYLSLVSRAVDMVGIAPLVRAPGDVVVAPRQHQNGGLAGYVLVNLSKETRQVTLPFTGQEMLTDEPNGPAITLQGLEVRVIRN